MRTAPIKHKPDPEAHFDVNSSDDDDWMDETIRLRPDLYVDLDAEDKELKHLPGKHDQTTHAGGRGGKQVAAPVPSKPSGTKKQSPAKAMTKQKKAAVAKATAETIRTTRQEVTRAKKRAIGATAKQIDAVDKGTAAAAQAFPVAMAMWRINEKLYDAKMSETVSALRQSYKAATEAAASQSIFGRLKMAVGKALAQVKWWANEVTMTPAAAHQRAKINAQRAAAARITKHLPGKHDQQTHAHGGKGAGESSDQSTNIVFNVDEWTSKSIPDRVKAFKALPVAEKDKLADAAHSIKNVIEERLAFAGDRPTTGTVSEASAARLKQIGDFMTPDAHEKIQKHMDALGGYLKDAGVPEEKARSLALDAVDALAVQENESLGRTLGDHGVRHVLGDVEMALDIMDKVPGYDTPQMKAAVTLAGIYHDTGYLTPPSQVFLDSDHPRWSGQHFEANVKASISDALGSDVGEYVSYMVDTHAGTLLDWENDPVASSLRLADNIALFQTEKMPGVLKYAPGAMDIIESVGTGKMSVEDGKKSLTDAINQTDYSPKIKTAMLKAADELSTTTPKLTLGMKGGRVAGFKWDNDAVVAELERLPEADRLNQVLDLGQRQFGKFAEAFGVDPKKFKIDDMFDFVHDGKVRLKTVVKTTKSEVALMTLDEARAEFAATVKHLAGKHDQKTHGTPIARGLARLPKGSVIGSREDIERWAAKSALKKTLYHVSDDIDAVLTKGFDTKKLADGSYFAYEEGVWTDKDPKNTLKVKLNVAADKILDVGDEDTLEKMGLSWDIVSEPGFGRILRRKGYQAWTDGSQVGVLDSSIIGIIDKYKKKKRVTKHLAGKHDQASHAGVKGTAGTVAHTPAQLRDAAAWHVAKDEGISMAAAKRKVGTGAKVPTTKVISRGWTDDELETSTSQAVALMRRALNDFSDFDLTRRVARTAAGSVKMPKTVSRSQQKKFRDAVTRQALFAVTQKSKVTKASAPDANCLKALWAEYYKYYSGKYIAAAWQAYQAKNWERAKLAFEKARDGFQPNKNPKEYNCLEAWRADAESKGSGGGTATTKPSNS